ncbi:MAG: hypothetical protein A2Z20_03655 [Bdellovibrionales bacterium RBG_16_40_8]|nr:MAG: hypothetical protein A2Z20_03655 [Bdellovibrionales bacterium RBG_16_40_8]
MKTNPRRKINTQVLRNNAGQAIVEYMLILIAVVVVFLLLLNFNKQFANWTTEHIGDYIACLIEVGELPILGDTTGSYCQYKNFTYAGGSGGPNNSGGSNNSGNPNGTNGTNDTNGSGGSKDKDKDKDKDDKNSTTESGTGSSHSRKSSSGEGGKSDSYSSGGIKRMRMARKSGSKDNNNKPSKEESDKFLDVGSGGSGGAKKIKITRRITRLKNGRAGEDERSETMTKVTGSSIEEGTKPEAKQMLVNRKPAMKNVQDDEIEGFSFGNFMRYLLMAAIIVAIVIFVGGQLMQVAKSSE